MAEGGAPPGVNMAAITSQMAFNGGGGGQAFNTSLPKIFAMIFGVNMTGTGIHDLGLKNIAVFGSGLIAHKSSLFARRLFSLNSKTKGMSPQQLAPDAKLKQQMAGQTV